MGWDRSGSRSVLYLVERHVFAEKRERGYVQDTSRHYNRNWGARRILVVCGTDESPHERIPVRFPVPHTILPVLDPIAGRQEAARFIIMQGTRNQENVAVFRNCFTSQMSLKVSHRGSENVESIKVPNG